MIGLLYPTRDCGEDDFTLLAGRLDSSPAVDFAYVPWGQQPATIERASLRAAVRELGEPGRLVAAAAAFDPKPRVVSWACSSCSFLDGPAGARAQAEALRTALGIPASSTSLAFVAAARHLGLSRIALASVYQPDITEAFVDFLAAEGIETVSDVSRDAASDRDLATWGPGPITDLVREADSPDAAAVLVPETALHTAPLLADLERRTGKPVLTATQVTVWHALTLLGQPATGAGLGTLLA
ncbi:maleate cis-trans isomerase family protein [Amycolatopsis jiangsuensis]|uniref:Maleate isomerase n=1 Tax=Amycolatopsis jiangsuensis TaxID=1181879 RepID=A0A840IQK7_9PSEU|nr:decarboxylase [Amycolatopsis jiangsuensis]MBB4684180.1 maleate isomerase [Amycolatopsis jiangsuensis]